MRKISWVLRLKFEKANPSIVTNDAGDPDYNANLRRMDENTPAGKRRSLLFAFSKKARQLHTKLVLKSQSTRSARETVWVPDERFVKVPRNIPIIGARSSRPVVTKVKDFRTSAYAAMSPTWVQCFEQMSPASIDSTKLTMDEVNAFKIPPHGLIFAKGVGAPSMGSYLGINGGKFKILNQ